MADVTTGPPISDPRPASVTPPPVENLPPQGQTFNPQTPPYPSVNQEPAINPQNDVVATVPSDSSQKESLTNLTSFSDQTAVPASQETQSISEKENIYTEICSQIIKEQEKIIGALAIEEADRVGGLAVDHVTYHCTVVGDGSKIIDDLIGQYRDFFGHAAVEVCKEAAAHFITKLSAEALPTSLR
jgi:hypothetical protein